MTRLKVPDHLGFLEVAWTSDLSPIPYADIYDDSERRGWFGDMNYLSRTKSQRLEPKTYVPWAAGALVGLVSYHQPQPTSVNARIAAYAQLEVDYHDFLPQLFQKLSDLVLPEGARTHVCVDSSPVSERLLAERAGLGFIGKNGLLIHPQHGSKFFIGVLFTDQRPHEKFFSPEVALQKINVAACGSCTACLQSCPTQAFEEEFRLNPTKCISYWTIESKSSEIPESIQSRQEPWLFGCDRCQDVCPWNRFSTMTSMPVSRVRTNLDAHMLHETASSSAQFFTFRGKSPLKRLSHSKWIRNLGSFLRPRAEADEVVSTSRMG